MRGAQAVDQIVEALGLARGRGEEVAIVIPLEVGDGVLGQQRIEALEQIIPHLCAGHIEHELAPHRCPLRPTFDVQAPVGVLTVEVAVGRDHFWLHPQAEIHAERVDALDQRGEAVREDIG